MEKKDEGRILVLGASGTNGSRVARGLLEKKKKVVVALRNPESKQGEEFQKQGAEVVEFDFSKSDTLTKALKNIHSVFLLVPFVENEVDPHNAFVDAAKVAGVKFIVSLSAFTSDIKADAHLAKEHGIMDKYLVDSGISYSLLLPTFFFTNWLWVSGSIKNLSTITGSNGGNIKYSWIDPDDIADAASEILLNPHKHHNTSYLLTGSKLYSDTDIAKILSQVLEKEIKYLDRKDEDYAALLSKIGQPKWQVDDMIFLENFKKTKYAQIVSDNFKQITGREPRTFESWIKTNKAAFS